METPEPPSPSAAVRETSDVDITLKEDDGNESNSPIKRGDEVTDGVSTPVEVVNVGDKDVKLEGEQHVGDGGGGAKKLRLLRLPGKAIRRCVECSTSGKVKKSNLFCSNCKKCVHKMCMLQHMTTQCKPAELKQLPRKQNKTPSLDKARAVSRHTARSSRVQLRCCDCTFTAPRKRSLIDHMLNEHSHLIASPPDTLKSKVNSVYKYQDSCPPGTEVDAEDSSVGTTPLPKDCNLLEEVATSSEQLKTSKNANEDINEQAVTKTCGIDEPVAHQEVEERSTNPDGCRKRSIEEANGGASDERMPDNPIERKGAMESGSDVPCQIKRKSTLEGQLSESGCGERLPVSVEPRIKVRKIFDDVPLSEIQEEPTKSLSGDIANELVEKTNGQSPTESCASPRNTPEVNTDNCSLSVLDSTQEPSLEDNSSECCNEAGEPALLPINTGNVAAIPEGKSKLLSTTRSDEASIFAANRNDNESLLVFGVRIKVERTSDEEEQDLDRVLMPPPLHPPLRVLRKNPPAGKGNVWNAKSQKSLVKELTKSRQRSLVETAMIDNSFWYLHGEDEDDRDIRKYSERIAMEFGELVILAEANYCLREPEEEPEVGEENSQIPAVGPLPLREASRRLRDSNAESLKEQDTDPTVTVETSTPKKTLHCKVQGCSFTTLRLNCLNLHVRSHRPKSISRVIINKSNHRKRMAKQSPATTPARMSYSCRKCPFKAVDKQSYNQHVYSHKACKCGICGHLASNLESLNVHKKTHSAELPFACDFCGYRGAQKANLVRHLSIHSKGRPYPIDDTISRVEESQVEQENP